MSRAQEELSDVELIGVAADEALKDVVIPPCPAIVVSLLREGMRDDVDFLKVSRLIGGDVALAASVLKAANSPFFGLRRKTQTVQQAVSVLGLAHLLKIVYAFALRQHLGKEAPMERLWERSHFNAVTCSLLAERLGAVPAEQAYAFGLFHDAGMAMLMQKHADYKTTLAQANARPVDPTLLEVERYRSSHVIVGAALARDWHLPSDTVWAIRLHHDLSIFSRPSQHATPPVRAMVALGCISEHVVAGFLGFPDDAEWLRVRASALGYLNLDEEGLRRLADGFAPHLQEIRASRA